MDLPKQDKNGVRTPVDIERRYRLGNIAKNEKELEDLKEERKVDDKLSTTSINPVQNKVVTLRLNKIEDEKQGKENGKGLSDNNFTDKDKQSIHTHNNKEILDSIDEGHVNAWNKLLEKKNYNSGDVYITTLKYDPNSILGYGTWILIDEKQAEKENAYTYYIWLRVS